MIDRSPVSRWLRRAAFASPGDAAVHSMQPMGCNLRLTPPPSCPKLAHHRSESPQHIRQQRINCIGRTDAKTRLALATGQLTHSYQ